MRNAVGLKQWGVTFLELMIVVAILGVLSMIALPSYNEYLNRSRRSEARESLSDFAARQEQFFTDNKRYATTIGELRRAAATENGYYIISITSVSTFAYELTATAQGSQANDTKCATMTLTSRRSRTPGECW